MLVHVCNLCGSDIGGYATWVEVPVNPDNDRIRAIQHPDGPDTSILHIQIAQGEDFDLCAACFRDALRRYLNESLKADAQDVPV